MRLFVGIGLPETTAHALAGAAQRSVVKAPNSEGRLRWTTPGNLHVTLSFLGQVEPSRLKAIEHALAGVTAPRVRLALDGLGLFANAGIVIAKVKSSPSLLNLAEQVIVAMERCGIPREQRPYQAHVTLARAKGKMPIHFVQRDDQVLSSTFDALEFRLYQSRTLPGGSQYEVLRAFPLG